MSPLEGKLALVTGGSRGIGRAISRRLAADGALVAVNFAGNATAASATVDAITSNGGDAFAVQADVSSTTEVERLIDEVVREAARRGQSGTIDVAISNAGVGNTGALVDTSEADYDRLMATHVKGSFFVAKSALPHMRAGGRIILISSGHATRPSPGVASYAVAKAAINSLATVLAIEAGPLGITANAIAPGWTRTDINRVHLADPQVEASVAGRTALGRIGRPEDIAAVASFLAGPDGGWVTGQVIEASGGFGLGH